MKTIHITHRLLILALFASACSGEQTEGAPLDSTSQNVGARPATLVEAPTYRFEDPDISTELHEDLAEISALTVLPDGRLGAVQDEKGLVFVIDRTTGDIEERRTFGEDGDYEGIERVGDRIYVLRSDGTLIEISPWSGAAPEIRTIETPLRPKNDTEGLAYDPVTNRLLIACKEDPGAGLDDDQRTVYAYDLARDAFIEEPVYVIDEQDIEQQLDLKGKFKPSALAVHPANNSIYVLSSTSRSIAVLTNGRVEQVHELSNDLFEQPEALAFLPDGTLYVASEGGKGPGMLYAFSPAGRR